MGVAAIGGGFLIAEVELVKALVIREAGEATENELAITLSALGKVHALRGDKAKAKEFYSRSLEIYLSQSDPDMADITDLRQRIAVLDAG